MSKKRALDSTIRTSQTFAALSYRQRDLWQGLIAIADDQGRLPGFAAYVRSRVWPFDDIPLAEVEADLDRLIELDMILKYEAEGKTFIQLINWWKYQSPQWAGASDYPAPPGWTDRTRYHGKEHLIITENWDKPGGFTISKATAALPVIDIPDLSGEKPGDKSPNELKENQVLREEEEVKEDKGIKKTLAADAAPPATQKTDKPPKQSRQHPEREQVIKHFLTKTGLPVPKTDNAHIKATQKLWWTPIDDLLELVDCDVGRAEDLINRTLPRLKDVTVSSPKSVIETAKAVFAENHREPTDLHSQLTEQGYVVHKAN